VSDHALHLDNGSPGISIAALSHERDALRAVLFFKGPRTSR